MVGRRIPYLQDLVVRDVDVEDENHFGGCAMAADEGSER